MTTPTLQPRRHLRAGPHPCRQVPRCTGPDGSGRAGCVYPLSARRTQRCRSGAGGRCRFQPRLWQRRGTCHRALELAGGGATRRRTRIPARPALRLRAASGRECGDDGADGRGGLRGGGRRRKHVQCGALHHGGSAWRADGRCGAVGPADARAADEPAGRTLRRHFGHDRNGGEPCRRLRHHPRGIRCLCRRQPPQGSGGARCRAFRCADSAGFRPAATRRSRGLHHRRRHTRRCDA